MAKQKDTDLLQKGIQAEQMQNYLQREHESALARLDREKEKEDNAIETKLATTVRQVRLRYQLLAVLLPPLLPLMVALVVFVNRRVKEREGVAKSRLR